ILLLALAAVPGGAVACTFNGIAVFPDPPTRTVAVTCRGSGSVSMWGKVDCSSLSPYISWIAITNWDVKGAITANFSYNGPDWDDFAQQGNADPNNYAGSATTSFLFFFVSPDAVGNHVTITGTGYCLKDGAYYGPFSSSCVFDIVKGDSD